MKIYLIIFLAIGLFTLHQAKACDGVYIAGHVGYNINTETAWVGDVPATFKIGYRFKQWKRIQFDLNYAHDSNADKDGDDYETTRDAIMLGGYLWMQ